MKTKVGIVGYGNLGRGVEKVLQYHDDLELIGIFTRRDPDSLDTASRAYHIDRLEKKTNEIDVLILCGGSATDIPETAHMYAKNFSTVDCYDNHRDMPNHFKRMNEAATGGENVSIIGTGWDPGVFSVQKLYSEALLPNGESYTFWGPGLSQGHSDAVRRLDGVKLAAQYTMPSSEMIEEIEDGRDVSYDKFSSHHRVVYVVLEEGTDADIVRESIITMPDYFEPYETEVHFISESEYNKNHTQLRHGGHVIRRGYTGDNTHTYKTTLDLDSNPEFTASVAVACARAAKRFMDARQFGAKSIFDIPPMYLLNESRESLIERLL